MRWFRIALPYLLLAVMTAMVIGSNRHRGSDASPSTVERDPVCQMEVNSSWGFETPYDGKTIHFCSQRCRDAFIADPLAFTAPHCLVCGNRVDAASALPATYLNRTYLLDSAACRRTFKADPAAWFMHTMWGIPDWLYYLSIAVVLLASFLMFEGSDLIKRRVRSRAGPTTDPALPAATSSSPPPADRVDLMRLAVVNRILKSRAVRALVQLFVAATFLLIIAAGLFGNQNPALNIAPLLTWTIWWCGLVVLIMFAGKAWCYACPWDALATWAERLTFWRKSDRAGGLNLPWPRVLRNIWLATLLFVLLTWIEIGFGVTMRPAATAWLALAMLVMAVVCAFLFDRKSFCRYGCLVGRVSGLYAMFAGLEVRHRDPDVCRTCRTKECLVGSDEAYGCPTFEYPGGMSLNTYCVQCTECLQACPHDNMTVQLRPWGADLVTEGRPRKDEAYLALLMLAISAFHGLTMTPVWGRLTGWIESDLAPDRILAFSMGMAVLMTAPILIYAALIWLSFRMALGTGIATDVSRSTAVSYGGFFIRYAYCLLPIALFYHLAHNLEHLLMEGPKVLALMSDPFGWGWNLAGTAGWRVPPMVSLDTLWLLQALLVALGHVYSLWVAKRIAHRIFPHGAGALRSQWPMLAGMIVFSIFSLWLLKQPMEMRTSAM